MVGSIDRINTRIDDLRKSGLQYLVLGPVTDDPKQIDLVAQRREALLVAAQTMLFLSSIVSLKLAFKRADYLNLRRRNNEHHADTN